MHRVYIVVQIETSFDRLYQISEAKTQVGRDHECELRLMHPLVSRRHAVIFNSAEGLRIQDLRSRNGTQIDGMPIEQEVSLNVGSVIQIAPFRLFVCLGLPEALRTASKSNESTAPTFHQQKMRHDAHLTPTQRRVYDLLIQGLIEKEVAAELRISVNTVHHHVKAIYKTLSVSTRGELFANRIFHEH